MRDENSNPSSIRYASQGGIFESLKADGESTAAEAALFSALNVSPKRRLLSQGFTEEMWKVTFGMPIVSDDETETLSSPSCRDGFLHLGRDFMPPHGNDMYLGPAERLRLGHKGLGIPRDKTVIWLSVLMSQHKNLEGDGAALLTTPALREIQSFFNIADLSKVPELKNLAKYHLGLNLGQDPQGMFDTGSLPAAMETFGIIPDGAPHIGVVGDIHPHGCRLGYHLADRVYNIPYMSPECVEQVGDKRFPRFISGGTRTVSLVEPVKKALKLPMIGGPSYRLAFVSAKDRATGRYARYHALLPSFTEGDDVLKGAETNANINNGANIKFDVITRRNGGQDENFVPLLEDDALMFYFNSAETVNTTQKRLEAANQTINVLRGLEAKLVVTLVDTPELMLLKCVAFLSHRPWWQRSRWVTVGEQLLAKDLHDEQLPCSVAEMSISSEGHMNLPASPVYEEEDREIVPDLKVQDVRDRMARSAVQCHGWLKFQTWLNLKDDASLEMLDASDAAYFRGAGLDTPKGSYKRLVPADKTHLRTVEGLFVNQLDEMPMFPNLNCEPALIGRTYDLIFSYLRALNDWVGQGNELETRLATTSRGKVQDANAKAEIFEILKEQGSFQGVTGKYRYEAGLPFASLHKKKNQQTTSGPTFGIARAPLLQVRQWYAVPSNGIKDPTLKGTFVASSGEDDYKIEWALAGSAKYPKHSMVDWPWVAPSSDEHSLNWWKVELQKNQELVEGGNTRKALEQLEDDDLLFEMMSRAEDFSNSTIEKSWSRAVEDKNKSNVIRSLLLVESEGTTINKIAQPAGASSRVNIMGKDVPSSQFNITSPKLSPEPGGLEDDFTRQLEQQLQNVYEGDDETLKACPWMTNTGVDFVVMCADGHFCNILENSKCCVERGSQRIQCPPNYRKMCENPVCKEANQEEYCCRNDDRCETFYEYGGLRRCTYTTSTSTSTSGFSTTSSTTTGTSSTTSGFSSTSSTTTRTSSTTSGFSSTSSTTTGTTRTSSTTSGFSTTSSTTTSRTTSGLSTTSSTTSAPFPKQITDNVGDTTTQYPGQTFSPQVTGGFLHDTTTQFVGQTFPPQILFTTAADDPPQVTTQYAGQTFPPQALHIDVSGESTTPYPGQTAPYFLQQLTDNPGDTTTQYHGQTFPPQHVFEDGSTTQYPGQTNFPQVTHGPSDSTTPFLGQTFPPQSTNFSSSETGGETTTQYVGQTFLPQITQLLVNNGSSEVSIMPTTEFAGQTFPPQTVTPDIDDGMNTWSTTPYPGQTFFPQTTQGIHDTTTKFAGQTFPGQYTTAETESTTQYVGQTFPELTTMYPNETTTQYPGQTTPQFIQQTTDDPSATTTQYPGQTNFPQRTFGPAESTTQFIGQTFPPQNNISTTSIESEIIVTTQYVGQTFVPQLTNETTTPFSGQTFPPVRTEHAGDRTTQYVGQTFEPQSTTIHEEDIFTTQYAGQTFLPQQNSGSTTEFPGQTFPPVFPANPGDPTTQYVGQTFQPQSTPVYTTQYAGQTFLPQQISGDATTEFPGQTFPPLITDNPGDPTTQYLGQTFPPQGTTNSPDDATTQYPGQTFLPQQGSGDATTAFAGQTFPPQAGPEYDSTTHYPGQTFSPQLVLSVQDSTTAFVGQTFPPQQTDNPNVKTTAYPGQTWPPWTSSTTTTQGFSSTTSGYSSTTTITTRTESPASTTTSGFSTTSSTTTRTSTTSGFSTTSSTTTATSTSTSGGSTTSTDTTTSTSGGSTTSTTLWIPPRFRVTTTTTRNPDETEPPGDPQAQKESTESVAPTIPPTTTTTTTTEYVYLYWYADRSFYFPKKFGTDGKPVIDYSSDENIIFTPQIGNTSDPNDPSNGETPSGAAQNLTGVIPELVNGKECFLTTLF